MESATSASSSLLGLFAICGAMFAGAFLAGLSCYKLNRRQLAWVNCFAAGLLLGTALGVIVPEGVRSIYESSNSGEVGTAMDQQHLERETGHDHDHHGEGKEEQHTERILGRCCSGETDRRLSTPSLCSYD